MKTCYKLIAFVVAATHYFRTQLKRKNFWHDDIVVPAIALQLVDLNSNPKLSHTNASKMIFADLLLSAQQQK